MKIAVYGEVNEAGSGAWCYCESLGELGHQVLRLDNSSIVNQYRRSPLRRIYRKVTKRLFQFDQVQHGNQMATKVEAFRPEIVIVLKGLYISPTDVGRLQHAGAWVVNVNHDDFFSVNRNNWSPLQHQTIPAYDYIFTTREVNVSEIRPQNTNVSFFEFAYFPRIHRPLPLDETDDKQWRSDVVFIGTWEEDRCAMLETLMAKVPAEYAIHGAMWNKTKRTSPVRRALRSSGVFLDDMAKAIGGAKISLGFLRKQSRDDYTQRTFEIPACGGLLLAERTPRHLGFFREGIEAEFFEVTSIDELCCKVYALLGDQHRRDSIREAGRQALLRQHHTYADRMQTLLAIYRAERSK